MLLQTLNHMVFRVKIAAIVLMVFFSSCDIFRAKEPCEQYIERAAMERLLQDVFLLESYLNMHNYRAGIRDSVPYYYAGVFSKHGIDAALFEKALRCYMLDDEQMTMLMDNMLSSLSIAQSKLDQQIEPEHPKDETLDYYGYPHYY